ncbi:hypothetical protein T265_13850 [Opisthorchis viverrini]|uniref:Neuropeptide Y n=1 Tax=Opisthorchis viverrini TaxID=6198 RepID=A0A075AEW9_OPIVI|nr:hypothetical protein T265_13850 [Opisthorchis viverrini]KER27139.1 hypothetical protein T265_13850 [Opisthorchis viverrini]
MRAYGLALPYRSYTDVTVPGIRIIIRLFVMVLIISSMFNVTRSINENVPFISKKLNSSCSTSSSIWPSFYTLSAVKRILTLSILPTADARAVDSSFPNPPAYFRDQEHMQNYVRALNYYFQVFGRPRFGR